MIRVQHSDGAVVEYDDAPSALAGLNMMRAARPAVADNRIDRETIQAVIAELTTWSLSERDRSLIAYALRTLRSDLERKADSTERKLALADLPESNFGYSEEKRAALVAAVKRNDADVQDINALYARLKLRGTEIERGGRAAAHEATLQRIERRLDAADAEQV